MSRETIYFVNSAPPGKIGGAEASARIWCQKLNGTGYNVSWVGPSEVLTIRAPLTGQLIPHPEAVRGLAQEISKTATEAVVIGDINHWTLPIAEALLGIGMDPKLSILVNREIFPIYKEIKVKRLLSNMLLVLKAGRVLRASQLKILAISKAMSRRAVELGLTKTEPKVYTPISEHAIGVCNSDRVAKGSGLEIVSVGRVVPEKGFLEFLLPVALACKKSRLPVKFSIIGPFGDAKYVREIQVKAEGTIELKGPRRGKQVCWEYNRADLLAHLVPPTEGFGLVLVEAAVHGLPILATNISTSEEIFNRGNRPPGRLVSYTVKDRLVSQAVEFITTCVENPNLRVQMSRAAGDLAIQFDRDRALEEFVALVLK